MATKYKPHPSTKNTLFGAITQLKSVIKDAKEGGADDKVIDMLKKAKVLCNRVDDIFHYMEQ